MHSDRITPAMVEENTGAWPCDILTCVPGLREADPSLASTGTRDTQSRCRLSDCHTLLATAWTDMREQLRSHAGREDPTNAYDWCRRFEDVADHIHALLPDKTCRIVMLGCVGDRTDSHASTTSSPTEHMTFLGSL
jgi:hypothetical protein